MNIITDVKAWQTIRTSITHNSIGFIPTMGNLHEGHLSLCRQSIAANAITVVSIFVNPTQFNNESDFDHYPHTIEEDQSLLAELGIDYLFIPNRAELYPDHYAIKVINEDDDDQILEAAFRPGHFAGVLTIVMKLFNLIRPTRAYFGEKDYQQLHHIKKMVAALFMPIDIIAGVTIRNENGLALSSRNNRLNAEQLKKASIFATLLQRTDLAETDVIAALIAAGFKVDYIATQWGRRLGAVHLDDIRLIDNVALS